MQDSYSIRLRATNSTGASVDQIFQLAIVEAPIPAPWPGGVDPLFQSDPGLKGTVFAIATLPDGKWLVGGTFSSIQGQPRGRIARLNADGTLDDSFMEGKVGANSAVRAIAVQSDGKVLIAGDFTSVNNTPMNRVARLHSDGSIDVSFGIGLEGANNTVYAMAVHPEGKILIAGAFTRVQGQPHNRMARLHPNGTVDTTFSPDSIIISDFMIYALVLQPDGKALIGGTFTLLEGGWRKRIARIDTHGKLDPTFGTDGDGADGPVMSLALQDDGKILAGGSFTVVNNVHFQRLARLHPDGTNDTSLLTWASGSINNAVRAIALQPNGQILIAGGFTSVGGRPRNRIARLDADGRVDETFGEGMAGASATVHATGRGIDRSLLIGGGFATVNGLERPRLALLNAGEPPPNQPPADLLLSHDSVVEGQPVGTLVGTLNTEDPDDTHTYTLIGDTNPNDNHRFTIHGDALRTAAVLDYQMQPSHAIRVRATDDGGLFVKRTFVVEVEANDPPTGILLSNALVPENRAAGAPVGTFTAVDPDEHDFHSFAFASGAGDDDNVWFTIDGDTLKTAAVFDHNARSDFTIRVRTTDKGGLFVEKAFSVTVGPDLPVTDIFLSDTSVPENQFVGTTVGSFTTEGAYENDPKTFALIEGDGSDDNALFSIDGDLLKTGSVLDREIRDTYSIRVRATNPGGLYFDKPLMVIVAESAPSIADLVLSNTAAAEDRPIGTPVGILRPLDPDRTETHTFTFIEGDGDAGNTFFSIDGDTLKTAAVFDRTIQDQYTIRVRAINSSGLFIRKNLMVTIVPATGDLDPAFYPGAINGPVRATARQADGKWIIGGDFFRIDGIMRRRLARLHADGSLDPTFLDGLPGISGQVHSVAVQEDGKIVVGGKFTSVNGESRLHIARLNSNGTLDRDFASHAFASQSATVRAIELLDGGKILIAGTFGTISGTWYNGIARLNDDGTIDPDFGSPSPPRPLAVASIAVQRDGKILLAGTYQSSAGGPSYIRIVRIGPDGEEDGTFSGPAGVHGELNSMTLQEDGRIVIGGAFSMGSGPSGIARLWPQGRVDTSFGKGLPGVGGGNPSRVHALATQSNGKVLLGGTFTTVHGEPCLGIARLNPDGSHDRAFGNGTAGANGTVYSISLQDDFDALIAGAFTEVNGIPRSRVALLIGGDQAPHDIFLSNSAVTENQPIGTPVGPLAALDKYGGRIDAAFSLVPGEGDDGNTFFELEDHRLRTTALMDHEVAAIHTVRLRAMDYRGALVEKIARITVLPAPEMEGLPGELDLSFQPPADINNTVLSVAQQSDGKIVIGGSFSQIDGKDQRYVARLTADGALDPPFVGDPSGGTTWAVKVQPNDRIVAAGTLRRMNADGTPDQSFDPPSLNGTVTSLGLDASGRILIGGSFTYLTPIRIARLNPSGTLDYSFGSVWDGPSSGIYAIAQQEDGRVVIGGPFTKINGITRQGIARLNPDGTLDQGFGYDLAGAPRGVAAIGVQPDGKILIGGRFTNVNGAFRGRIARLNTDGTLDETFGHQLSGANATVSALASQPDGKILIGGHFTAVNDRARNRIARLNTDGSLDTTFGSGLSGADDGVESILLQDDGGVIVGGRFTSVNDLLRSRMARLHGGSAPPTEVHLSNRSITLDQPADTVIGSFSAADLDVAQTHTFALVPGEGDEGNTFFAISGNKLRTAVSFGFEMAGSHTIRVRAANSSGLFTKKIFTMIVDNGLYAAWAEDLPESERGTEADPGAHGIPNLLRYAFGMDALHPERERLLQIDRQFTKEEGHLRMYLTLTYTRRTDDPSLTYIAEASDDLLTWASLAGMEEIADDGNGETETVTLTDSHPIDGFTKRFLRVLVER